jgi:hypothetical protein
MDMDRGSRYPKSSMWRCRWRGLLSRVSCAQGRCFLVCKEGCPWPYGRLGWMGSSGMVAVAVVMVMVMVLVMVGITLITVVLTECAQW